MYVRNAVALALFLALVGTLGEPSASAASRPARSSAGFSVGARVRVPPAVRVVETGPPVVLSDGSTLLNAVLELRGDEPFLVQVSAAAGVRAEVIGLASGPVSAGRSPGWFVQGPEPGSASIRVPVQVRVAGATAPIRALPVVFSVRTLI